MTGWFEEPYIDLYRALPRRFCGPAKTVRRQQTCPGCGRKLVNIYEKQPHVWLCRACWEQREMVERIAGLIERREGVETRAFDFSDADLIHVEVKAPGVLEPPVFTMTVDRDEWDDDPAKAMAKEIAELSRKGKLQIKKGDIK